jgi:hypothetical protein
MKNLDMAKKEIGVIDSTFDPHGTGNLDLNWKTPLLYLYRKAFGVYHIYPRTKFLDD